MKNRGHIFTAAALALLAAIGSPQNETPPPAAPAEPAAGTEAAPSTGFSGDLSGIMGSGFKTFEGEQITYSPDGRLEARGKVYLEMTDMSVRCNALSMDPVTKIIVANGTPLKIVQANIDATCKKLTYDTVKKVYVLEQNPVVNQTEGDSVTRLSADKITLTQGKDGKMGIKMDMDPDNPGKLPTISTMKNTAAKPAEAPKSEPPTRIGGRSGQPASLIRMPTPSN